MHLNIISIINPIQVRQSPSLLKRLTHRLAVNLFYVSFLLLPFLFFLPASSISAEDLHPLDDMDGLLLGRNFQVLEDPNGEYTIESVSSDEYLDSFVDTDSLSPAYGFSDSTYWIRMPLDPGSEKVKWFLEIGYPMLDYIRLYEPEGSGFRVREAGDHQPFHQREIDYRNFIFSMEESGAPRTVYLRIATSSAMNLPLIDWSADHLFSKINMEQTFLGAYVGIMVVMVLYNFFLFLSIKDRSYLYYVLFVATYALFQVTLNGLAFEYLWSEWIWWANNSLPFFICASSLWALAFGRKFLQTDTLAPVLYKIITAMMGLSLLGMGISLTMNYQNGIRLATILAILFSIFMIGSGIILALRKYRPAYYYLIAWFFFLVGITMYALKTFAILPDNFLTTWSIQIGSVMEVVLLSLGLADRINILKKDRENAQQELLESRQIMLDSFARFVPREFLNFLERDNVLDVSVGDAVQKDLTVLFSDIRNFTALSEQMGPEEIFKFLNHYLDRMGVAIHDNYGFIDKFIGDAVMALFSGVPDSAVKAAVEMRQILNDYNHVRKTVGLDSIEMGVGLHTGELILGTVGSGKRLDTTVIGDTVNVASRLESLTKMFRIPVLISEMVYMKLEKPENYHIRDIDSVRPKGKSSPLFIYEVFDADPPELFQKKCESANEFSRALSYYRSGEFYESRSILMQLVEFSPQDNIYLIYLKRCNQLLEKPPGPKWSGVSRMR